MKRFIEDELNTIRIPDDLHRRCLAGVRKAEKDMERKRKKQWLRRIATSAAAFAVCVMFFTQTTAADTIKGFFKDIMRVDGAITGTAYEVGMDEIQIRYQETAVDSETSTFKIEAELMNPDQVPYSELEALQIGEGQILDEEGNIVYEIQLEANMLEASAIENGKVFLELKVSRSVLESNQNYVLKIHTLYGHKKADAPLYIYGEWEVKLPLIIG